MAMKKSISYSKLEIPNSVSNTEGKLQLIGNQVYKIFYQIGNLNLDDKKYILDCLKDLNRLKEIVYPTRYLEDNEKFIGYSMNYIRGRNLQLIIDSPNIELKDKIIFLDQIGRLLEKMQEIRNNTHKDFFINDLHSGNIIVDKRNLIRVIDCDSFKIADSKICYSKELYSSSFILRCKKKYKTVHENKGKMIVPSQDTEIYCYIMMILRAITGKPYIGRLKKDAFDDLLNKLKSAGLSNSFLDIINRINDDSKPNEIPKDMLHQLKYIKKIQY